MTRLRIGKNAWRFAPRIKSRDTRRYLGTGHRMREDMATVGNNFEIEDAVLNHLWRHFGFPIYTNTTSEKRTDKTKTACKYCKRLLTYTGNMSNMQQHISRHHSEKQSNVTPPPERKLPKGQTTLMRGFPSPLPHFKLHKPVLLYLKRFYVLILFWCGFVFKNPVFLCYLS